MEKLLSDKIFFKNDDYLDVYLDSFDNSNILTNNSFKHTCGKISSLLATSKTRGLGYAALDKFLDHTGCDELKDKLNMWTTLILKTSNEHQMLQHSQIIWQILTKMAIRYHANSEMCKEFTVQHLPKIYDLVKLSPASGSVGSSLFCVYTCLKLFSCHHGASKEFLEDFLIGLLTTSNEPISLYSGKCLHLLQQVKNVKNNTGPKVQWLAYQRQLLDSIHSILNMLFANVTENCDRYTTHEQLLTSKLQISDDPLERYATLYHICCNLIQYLIISLRDPFPVKKSINAKKILNVINRGVSVTCVQLQRNPIGENILLSLFLPKLHIRLLNLLNTIIIILCGHLKPYSSLILDILSSQLKWTSTNTNKPDHYRKSILALRIQTYNTLRLWCETMNYGSRCDLIIENIIGEIFNDLTTEMNGFNQISIKKSNDRSITTNRTESKSKTESLSVAALLCLQKILLTSSNVIRPTTIQLIQTNLIQIGINIFDTFLKNPNDYGSGSQCRMEIYKTLHLMLITSHHLGLPSIEIAVDILNNATVRERNIHVRNSCYSLLLDLEKIIHPTNNSLLFPIGVRDMPHNIFSLKEKQYLEDGNALQHESNESKEVPKVGVSVSADECVEETINVRDEEQHIPNGKMERTNDAEQLNTAITLHSPSTTTALSDVEVLRKDDNEMTKSNNKTESDEDTDTDFMQPKRKKLLLQDHKTSNGTITVASPAAASIDIRTTAANTTAETNTTATCLDTANKSCEEMLADLESEFVYELNTI